MANPEYENSLRTVAGGEVPGQRIEREGLQWRTYVDAFRVIYPLISRLPEEVLREDETLNIDKVRPEAWTTCFLDAAFQPPKPELDEFGGLEDAAWNQLNQHLAERSGYHIRSYSQEIIEARFSLLFPIAVMMHEGGKAIYPAYGLFGPDFKYQQNLKFRERLERIAHYLRRHKWLVKDIIEENYTHAFVASPDRWIEARMEFWKKSVVRHQEDKNTRAGVKAEASSTSTAQAGDETQTQQRLSGSEQQRQERVAHVEDQIGDLTMTETSASDSPQTTSSMSSSASDENVLLAVGTLLERAAAAAATRDDDDGPMHQQMLRPRPRSPSPTPIKSEPTTPPPAECDRYTQAGPSAHELRERGSPVSKTESTSSPLANRRLPATYRFQRARSDSHDSWYDSSD